LKKNATKSKLYAGETVFGCFVRYPDPALVEVLSYQPWDFLVFDAEHGTIEARDVENMVRAAELHAVTSIVRVTTNQPPTLLRFLDTGAQGVQVPWVSSGEEAQRAVQSVKYHPRGIRGLAGVRASDYGQRGSLDNYVRQANNETLVVLQVETMPAVKRLAEIIEVPDVDVFFVGPNDLSQSFGFPGQPQHPDVQAVIAQVSDAVMRANKAFGIMVPNLETALEWKKRGARYITISLENILSPALRDYLTAVRK
jgi:4-hydroxy-2-oxoheptanedioate aldolase